MNRYLIPFMILIVVNKYIDIYTHTYLLRIFSQIDNRGKTMGFETKTSWVQVSTLCVVLAELFTFSVIVKCRQLASALQVCRLP